MKIVAHMPVRNEFDVIAETIREAFRWVDILVVLDGQSDDGTQSLLWDLAASYTDTSGRVLDVHSEPDPDGKFTDYHLRTRLLELTRSYLEPGDWILSIDADEIYQDYLDANGMIQEMNPKAAISLADEAGANVVRSFVPQFWLTFDDLRCGALNEDDMVDVQERRRWYSWGHMGTFAWKWHPEHYYPADKPQRTPELPGYNWRQWQQAGPIVTVCKHYCIRSVEQGLKRAQERLERGGRKYFGKYGLPCWIIDEQIAGLHYYDGTWNTTENHDRLCAYMAGKLTGDRKGN